MGRKKKYFTEEEKKNAQRESWRKYYYKNREKSRKYRQEHKEERSEYNKQYYQEHKEECSKLWKQWYQEHKDKFAEYINKYNKTKIGKAHNLLTSYRQSDKKINRGECTLTAKWIVENIFTKPCIYCGKTDWTELGCDRIDNSKPHTPDNVVPCCTICNRKRGKKPFEEFLREMQ